MTRYNQFWDEPLTTPRQRRFGWIAGLIGSAVLLFAPSFIPDADAADGDQPLPCIRHYESRDNYRAVSKSGKYRGAYQADVRTWNGVMRGPHPDYVGVRPERAPEDIQDSFARVLHHQRGLQPWSKTVRKNCR